MLYSFVFLFALSSLAAATFNLDTSTNAVGICYSLWHSLGYKPPTPPQDITNILLGKGAFGKVQSWHFWGRPAGGYYTGGNRTVLDRHFSQISGAGIDFIILDATNVAGYGGYQVGLFTEPADVLVDEMAAQRRAGKTTPNIAFWARTNHKDHDPSAVGAFIRDRYYHNASLADLWVTYEGKPLLVTTDLQPSNLSSFFTMRKMWGLQASLAPQEWSFLQNVPQQVSMSNSTKEQISVCTAKQSTYMTNFATAKSRQKGATYQSQWQTAFNVRPRLVLLTWWNEWMAQRQPDGPKGQVQFVDNYDEEYSRDIEPQDPAQPGSHGSKYLDWTTSYVKAYKANQPMPKGLTGY